MTTALIKKIINERCNNSIATENPNHINLYGFKLTSGKELIIPRINDDIVTSKPDDSKWKLNETDNTIEIHTLQAMPNGVQTEIIRIIDVSDIEEVIIYYDPKDESHEFGGITS